MRIKHPMNILRSFKTVRVSSLLSHIDGLYNVQVIINAVNDTRDYEMSGTAEADTFDKAENLAMLKALIRLNELSLDEEVLLNISCCDLFDNELGIDTVEKLQAFVEYCMPGVEKRISKDGLSITLAEAGAIELFMLQQKYQQDLEKEPLCEKKPIEN